MSPSNWPQLLDSLEADLAARREAAKVGEPIDAVRPAALPVDIGPLQPEHEDRARRLLAAMHAQSPELETAQAAVRTELARIATALGQRSSPSATDLGHGHYESRA